MYIYMYIYIYIYIYFLQSFLLNVGNRNLFSCRHFETSSDLLFKIWIHEYG